MAQRNSTTPKFALGEKAVLSNPLGAIPSSNIIRVARARNRYLYIATPFDGLAVPDWRWLTQGQRPQKSVALFGGDRAACRNRLWPLLAVVVSASTARIQETVNVGHMNFVKGEATEEWLGEQGVCYISPPCFEMIDSFKRMGGTYGA